jgi:hypothetical protein
MALAQALAAKIETVPGGVAKGQMRNALNTFLRIGPPWIFFESR